LDLVDLLFTPFVMDAKGRRFVEGDRYIIIGSGGGPGRKMPLRRKDRLQRHSDLLLLVIAPLGPAGLFACQEQSYDEQDREPVQPKEGTRQKITHRTFLFQTRDQ